LPKNQLFFYYFLRYYQLFLNLLGYLIELVDRWVPLRLMKEALKQLSFCKDSLNRTMPHGSSPGGQVVPAMDRIITPGRVPLSSLVWLRRLR
jgi:hypothetical protein